MSEKHTPGNWGWVGKSEPIIFSSQAGKEEKESVDIAMCFDITNDEQIANARLIAAAPDLLEACEDGIKFLDSLLVGNYMTETQLWMLLENRMAFRKILIAAIVQARENK